MGKSTFFTGQPVLNQLLSLLDRNGIRLLAKRGGHDRYYRYFDTYTHLVTMLYCAFNKCTSSREVVSGMKACLHKLNHTGIIKCPGRSTLCDANAGRSFEVFARIYDQLYCRHKQLLPDSRLQIDPRLFIADASTITLFQRILNAPSPGKSDGRRKGGIKVHTLINAADDVPLKVSFTAASANDMPFLKEIHLQPGSFIVFDKGYVNYSQYERFCNEGVFFVTRQKKDARYIVTNVHELREHSRASGVLSDRTLLQGTRTQKDGIKLKVRLVAFFDKDSGRTFEFLTNNFSLPPEMVADIYKKRWLIEVLFKRVKQNFPLKYFLGDNENAIKIQIWCAFIADLLIKLVQVQLKRKWAFSNLTSIIRLHLMSYIHLFNFLNNPERLSAVSGKALQLELGGLDIDFKT
ncbi:IS4 family transposase [Mucilaginibacter pallidiroseus]|uniref:IS4 family transposase n=1 Tax=Mucilaginibacter pallidiroseus TaxID=2599295 RepID=A0A563TWJ0_9SPHI|nr:IS4 family transposase [Mucilaginibacter pallidiroseus]TWR23717.1 IS4 family transposase [Mucilaginibacter pallidiroseus]